MLGIIFHITFYFPIFNIIVCVLEYEIMHRKMNVQQAYLMPYHNKNLLVKINNGIIIIDVVHNNNNIIQFLHCECSYSTGRKGDTLVSCVKFGNTVSR